MESVSIRELQRHPATIINRATRNREAVEITRRGKPVAILAPSRIWHPEKPGPIDEILKCVGIARDREGKTDVSINHDKYIAEAIAERKCR